MTTLVCISDTHLATPELPDGDILIHAGDMTFEGESSELLAQFEWLGSQKDRFEHILVIPGNHDFGLEKDYDKYYQIAYANGITLLNEESVTINGLKYFGSPITPMYGWWAFMRFEPDIKKHWAAIPDDTNVLITHGPPYAILDETDRGTLAGCPNLLKRIKELTELKLHVFGHLHESRGFKKIDEVTFVNAAIMDEHYNPSNEPIVVEL